MTVSTPTRRATTTANAEEAVSRQPLSRIKPAFTMKDVKELAGTILALWLAGLLIGVFYYAQLAGHVG